LIRSRRGKTWALLFRSEVILSCRNQRLASEVPIFGQCIRLGKTVLARPAASRRTPHAGDRAVARFGDRHGQDMTPPPLGSRHKDVSCFSLFTMLKWP
jgi:hypothetical protein